MAADPKKRDAEKRVTKGVKWLDKNVPNWVEKFTRNGLKYGFDLTDPSICVLGNVFHKSIESGLEGFHWATDRHDSIDVEKMAFTTSEHGYDYDGPYEDENEEWQYLAEAWQEEILYRQCKKKDKKSFSRVMRMLTEKYYKGETF